MKVIYLIEGVGKKDIVISVIRKVFIILFFQRRVRPLFP